MPPSPATRISPGRELRAENHKRRHSLESGILHREREDDLALFNEVQNKERESFLLRSNDNFDDMFSTKLRYFSDHKLGISVPAGGESSDLLNAEGDKNDYDWLITPPETPLFRSLDDEAPQVDLAHRGRTRSQLVPISRSPTMEKGHINGRGLASPQHLSPSPRSRHISPSRGLSPPPSKPTPPRRSNTPTPRRISSASPVKTSRGNSASPKIKVWQSNVPGFSSEAPPNLCTSLAERPASYVRGSSPASRNGRKSMSPTASRSISSSHSRGSVVSSGDDDLDLLQSISVSSFSRKPTKSLSSSAPKRSFDLVRQVNRKGPQNMFRPLLSNVPSSTFHAGNASSQHYSLTSRNSSSITTSSNASSDLAINDEVFVMDQADDLNEDIENKIVVDPLCSRHGESKRDNMDTAVTVMDMKNDYSDANGSPDMVTCSKCGLIFHSAEVVMEGDLQFCRECKSSEVNSTLTNPVEVLERPASNTESMKVNESQHSCNEPSQNLSIMPTEQNELNFSTRQVIKLLQHDWVDSNSQVDVLKSANIVKGHIFESRSFTASNTSYDDFSYMRDSVNSTKSSISASMSSSVDLGFSRPTEGRIYRQSSGQKSDMENYRYEMPNTHKRSVSSMSGASAHMLSVATSCHEDGFEEFEEKTCSDPCKISLASESMEAESTCANIENNIVFKTQENVETLSAQSEMLVQEEDIADRVDIAEVPNPSSLDAICEMEIENADVVSDDSQFDVDSTDAKSCMNELRHDEDIKETVEEFDISQHAHDVLEESRISSEETGDTKSRRLTLEEATDAILFCSSIVHNLAYKAANIAINNETSPTEVLRPTVTFVGKPDSERRDNTRLRTMRKRSSKFQKARQKRPEMDTKPPSCNAETDENSRSPCNVGAPNNVDSLKPLKLESKCNCVIM